MHSGLACVNFVFKIHTTQKLIWPLEMIIQIVVSDSEWFPNFNNFEAIFAFLTNNGCNLPYISDGLKPPKILRPMRAGNENTVDSRILVNYLSPQKLETVYARILTFIWNFCFTLKIIKEAAKVPGIRY